MSRPILLGLATVLLVVAGAGAFFLSRGSGEDGVSRPAARSRSEIHEALTSFDPAAPRTGLLAIHEAAAGDPDAVRTVALDILESGGASDRWAAVYALSIVIEHGDTEVVDALRESLEAEDLDERLAAAEGLVASGEKVGFPVLIDLLGSTETTTTVVVPLWRVARGLLLTYATEDLGGLRSATDTRSAAAARPAWESWWAERGTGLTWDAQTGRFR